jgi:hypothetical protein
VIVSLFSVELLSFLATEANLLLFNNTPKIYQSRFSGNDWRTQKEAWGSWHKINAADRHKEKCFDVSYRSNEVGARDRSFSQRKIDSRSRYLLLGDSFAEGYGVNFDDTAKVQLERLLGIDVYNFGSDGYFGPVQYYLVYKNLARSYEHDGVILFFLPANDFTDNDFSVWKTFHPSFYRPYYLQEGEQYRIFYPDTAIPTENYEDQVESNKVIRFLDRYTFTLNTLRTVKYLVARSPIEKLGYSGYFDAAPEQQEAAVHFLERIATDVKPKKLVILIIPNREDMARIRSGHVYKDQLWYKKLQAMQSANANLEVVDMAENMPDDYSKLFLSCDNHWNQLGNLEAAKILAAHYGGSPHAPDAPISPLPAN